MTSAMVDAMPSEAINRFDDYTRDEICDLVPSFCTYKGWIPPPAPPPLSSSPAPLSPRSKPLQPSRSTSQCPTKTSVIESGTGGASQLGIGIGIGLIPFAVVCLWLLLSRRRGGAKRRVEIPADT